MLRMDVSRMTGYLRCRLLACAASESDFVLLCGRAVLGIIAILHDGDTRSLLLVRQFRAAVRATRVSPVSHAWGRAAVSLRAYRSTFLGGCSRQEVAAQAPSPLAAVQPHNSPRENTAAAQGAAP